MDEKTLNLETLPATIVNPVEQTKPSSKMNAETYGFVSSKDILDVFAKHNWTQVSAQHGRPRKLDRIGYQKHLVKLENPDFPAIEGLSAHNASKPQLVLLNSHDGTSALNLFWGVYRMACLNGVISGVSISSFRLIHSQNVTKKLPEAIEYMLNNFGNFVAQIKSLQSLSFSEVAMKELVKTAYDARLASVGKLLEVDYTLPINREQDMGKDAFTVFNRVQEALMRGGIRYKAERNILDANGVVVETKVVDSRTRKLSSVAQHVNLNRLVYDAAVKLAA